MPSAKDLVFKLRSLGNEFRTDDAVAELDALDRSLDATARQAATSAREVRNAAADLDAPGFDKAAAEAESTAARMRAAAEDMAAGVRQGAAKIDTETDKIRADMADTGREAGGELVQNIAEGIGSGSGSITDVVQGTLGGLVSMAASIPGPFAVAGAAAAAGVGVLFSAIKKQSEEARARVQELVGAFETVGSVSSKAARQARLDQWKTQLSEAPGKAQELAKGMEAAGIKSEEVLNAVAGTRSEAERVLGKIEEWQREQNDVWASSQNVTKEMVEQNEAVAELEKAIRGANGELQLSQEQWSAVQRVVGGGAGELNTQVEYLKELNRQAGLLGEKYDYTFRDRKISVTIATRDRNGRPIRMDDPRGIGGAVGA